MAAVSGVDVSLVTGLWIGLPCDKSDHCKHRVKIRLDKGEVQQILNSEEIKVLIDGIAREKISYGGGWGGVDANCHFDKFKGVCTDPLADVLDRFFKGK